MAAKKGTKPPVEEVETAEVTKDQLLALGAEMNTLLFPGEEVDFTEMDEDGILEQIKADAGSIDPGDQFSDESKATLAAIGIDVEWTVPEAKETKPAGKGKAAAKPKAEKKASEPKAKKEKTPVDLSKSNKAIIYLAWSKNKELAIPDLIALVDGAVKETTVKIWLNMWKNDKNLPAIAKQA